MLRFTSLYFALDATTSTNEKVGLLRDYFKQVNAADGAWAIFFLTGRKLKRLVSSAYLREWARERANIDAWLFEDCYSHVGDLSETISLLVHPLGNINPTTDVPLAQWVEDRIRPLSKGASESQKQIVLNWWTEMGRDGTYILCKILMGGLRIGVSQILVTRALAEAAGKEVSEVAGHLVGEWNPTPESFAHIFSNSPVASHIALAKPFPFSLAHQLESQPETLGDVSEWLVEWKWDGIRAQVIARGGEVSIWTRGDELVTDRFPELRDAACALLPEGGVLDGEILAFRNGAPLRFGELQKRIGKLKVGQKLMDEVPIAFMAYDVLEYAGTPLRDVPLEKRRALLETLVPQCPAPILPFALNSDPGAALNSIPASTLKTASAGSLNTFFPPFYISEALQAPSWAELATIRENSRNRGVEGFMLKRKSSFYGVGRKKGDWWKWKIDPYTIDAVLIYAQAGHGKRANLYTDYTFAVWEGGALVPVAKAYSGLDNGEIEILDRWIRAHTKERFGPVRSVEPVHVFELAFEAISLSKRHKAGVAVRFPRIARWRLDKKPEDANTLDDLKALLNAPSAPGAANVAPP